MSYTGSGFFNTTSGTWVSAEHAAQHVGETVNGFTKCHGVNGFYMTPAASSNPFAEAAMLYMMAPVFDQIMGSYASTLERAMDSYIDSINRMFSNL